MAAYQQSDWRGATVFPWRCAEISLGSDERVVRRAATGSQITCLGNDENSRHYSVHLSAHTVACAE